MKVDRGIKEKSNIYRTRKVPGFSDRSPASVHLKNFLRRPPLLSRVSSYAPLPPPEGGRNRSATTPCGGGYGPPTGVQWALVGDVRSNPPHSLLRPTFGSVPRNWPSFFLILFRSFNTNERERTGQSIPTTLAF